MKDTVEFPGGDFVLTKYKDQDAFERGEVEQEIKFHNKMTNASLAAIAGLVGGTGAVAAFAWLALGTSNAAVSASSTALGAEIVTNGLQRTASTNSRITTTQANDTLSVVVNWSATGVSTIQEIGIFNASSAGTMLARALPTPLTTANGNVLTGTYTWQVVGN